MKKRILGGILAVMMTGVMLAGSGQQGSGESGQTEGTEDTDDAAGTKDGTDGEDAADAKNGADAKDRADAKNGADAEQTAAGDRADTDGGQETEIQVFIAASLNTVMAKLAEQYNQNHPEVKITYNADSSGTLLTQIQEGYECDIFFSAAEKQMDQLEEDGLIVEGTRKKVVNNQVVVVTRKDSGTKVTGLENLGEAESIALAGGSVPVGKYTRQAFMNLGILDEAEDASVYTTQQISEALGGVEISEQDNVSKVLAAVAEGSCEVGTTYYSDTYGYEDRLDILQTVGYDLSGDVIYPIARVVNEEADETQTKAAEDFLTFVTSDEAKEVFEEYYFDTNIFKVKE